MPEPDEDVIKMSAIDPIKVSIPTSLSPFLTFDSADRTLIWIDDPLALKLAESTDLVIMITLTNFRGDQFLF